MIVQKDTLQSPRTRHTSAMSTATLPSPRVDARKRAVASGVRYTVVGVTDERNACDCCGRGGLKRVVVLRPSDGGEHVYYGTTCAAWVVLGQRLTKHHADAYVDGELRERAHWRLEAEHVDRAMRKHAVADVRQVLWEYRVRNRSETVTPDVVWSTGALWFGFTEMPAPFGERLAELGWSVAPFAPPATPVTGD